MLRDLWQRCRGGDPHAACPRIWLGSEIPVDAYTNASSDRTTNPKKSQTPQITTYVAHIKTARCLGHGIMAPDSNLQGPDSNLEAPNSNLQAPDHSFQATESNLQRPDSTSRLQIPTSQKQIPTARLQIPTYRVQSQPAPDSNLHGPSRAWARGPRPEAMGQWAEASWGSEA